MQIWSNAGEESDWFKPLETSTVDVEDVNPLVEQLLHFAQVMKGAEPKSSVKSAVQSLRVIDGILEAIRTGVTVKLDPRSNGQARL